MSLEEYESAAECTLDVTSKRYKKCALVANVLIDQVAEANRVRLTRSQALGADAATDLYHSELNTLHTKLLPVCASCPERPIVGIIEADIF